MLVKGKVRYTSINGKGERHNVTITVSGRTAEELQGRMEKCIDRLFFNAQWQGLEIILR